MQINHPRLDATSIATADAMTRNSLKVVMAALALAGITGMHLRQVTTIGLLGLLGYAAFAAGVVPQYERLFALPTGFAFIGLGCSLWREKHIPAAQPVVSPVTS